MSNFQMSLYRYRPPDVRIEVYAFTTEALREAYKHRFPIVPPATFEIIDFTNPAEYFYLTERIKASGNGYFVTPY